jgi:16S rRNA (cytidine1402-2'-O)-methyltransferase
VAPVADGVSPGVLVIAGTPIGDPADASPRLRAELEGADVVAAEDTRRTRRLADDLGITLRGRVVSYYDAVELRRLP